MISEGFFFVAEHICSSFFSRLSSRRKCLVFLSFIFSLVNVIVGLGYIVRPLVNVGNRLDQVFIDLKGSIFPGFVQAIQITFNVFA